jgi:hypothetical protein
VGDPSAFEGRRTFAEFLTESCGRRKDWRESQHIGTLLEVAGWDGRGPRPAVTIMPDGQLVVGQVEVDEREDDDGHIEPWYPPDGFGPLDFGVPNG